MLVCNFDEYPHLKTLLESGNVPYVGNDISLDDSKHSILREFIERSARDYPEMNEEERLSNAIYNCYTFSSTKTPVTLVTQQSTTDTTVSCLQQIDSYSKEIPKSLQSFHATVDKVHEEISKHVGDLHKASLLTTVLQTNISNQVEVVASGVTDSKVKFLAIVKILNDVVEESRKLESIIDGLNSLKRVNELSILEEESFLASLIKVNNLCSKTLDEIIKFHSDSNIKQVKGLEKVDELFLEVTSFTYKIRDEIAKASNLVEFDTTVLKNSSNLLSNIEDEFINHLSTVKNLNSQVERSYTGFIETLEIVEEKMEKISKMFIYSSSQRYVDYLFYLIVICLLIFGHR